MSAVAAPSLVFPALARTLALGFSPLDEERLGRLRSLAVGLSREELAPPVAEAVSLLVQALDEQATLDDLAAEHELLFGMDGLCPANEGSYERDPFRETRLMADVAGFYAAFGATTEGPVLERPDHAGCELEFLAFLALRRAEAEAAGDAELADVCREAEDGFLREHVGRFLPRLCSEVAGISVMPLFLALARLGAEFTQAELAARGLEVRPVSERRLRTVVEADALECGDSCGLAQGRQLQQIEPPRPRGEEQE